MKLRFAELGAGDRYMNLKDGQVYMKVAVPLSGYVQGYDTAAVDIRTGIVSYMWDATEVHLIGSLTK